MDGIRHNLRNRNGRDKYMPVDCIVINEARNNVNASARSYVSYIYNYISGYFRRRLGKDGGREEEEEGALLLLRTFCGSG